MSAYARTHLVALLFLVLLGVGTAPALGVIRGDDYPPAWRDAPMGAVRDDWQLENRYCGSFVLWRLLQDGTDLRRFTQTAWVVGYTPDQTLEDRIASARREGWEVTARTTPSVGAIAHWTGPEAAGGGYIGHVAYVAEVDGDMVILEDYNGRVRGGYDARQVPAASVPRYLTYRRIAPETAPAPEEPATSPPARSALSFLGVGRGRLEMLVDLADRSRVRVVVTRAGKTISVTRMLGAGPARALRVRTGRLGRGPARVRIVVAPVDSVSARDPDGVLAQRRVRLVSAQGG